MNKNVPEEDKPIYDYGSKTFRGEAIGGPFNGRFLSDTALTIFVTKPYRNPVMPYYATPEEQMEIEKKHRLAAEKNKKYPDRYDFDIEQGKWIWVNYTIDEQGG